VSSLMIEMVEIWLADQFARCVADELSSASTPERLISGFSDVPSEVQLPLAIRCLAAPQQHPAWQIGSRQGAEIIQLGARAQQSPAPGRGSGTVNVDPPEKDRDWRFDQFCGCGSICCFAWSWPIPPHDSHLEFPDANRDVLSLNILIT